MSWNGFFAVEGIDGSGKSDMVGYLVEQLRARGGEGAATREPGGTPQGEAIRSLILSGADDTWDPHAELLLMTAARVEHVRRVIKPALALGRFVISDRYVGSTIAYQGAGRGMSEAFIRQLHAAAVGDHRGVGVEQGDECVDVHGFPRLLEVPDDPGLPGRRSHGRLRGADAPAGRGGQLAARRRGAADDLGHFGEGIPEDIVQDERDALTRSQLVEHDLQGDPDGVGERDVVGGVTDQLLAFDVTHRDGGAGAQPVEAQPGGDRRQPGRQALDLGVGPVQPEPGLLHDVLRLRVVAEDAAGDRHQPRSFLLEQLRLLHGVHPLALLGHCPDVRDGPGVTRAR